MRDNLFAVPPYDKNVWVIARKNGNIVEMLASDNGVSTWSTPSGAESCRRVSGLSGWGVYNATTGGRYKATNETRIKNVLASHGIETGAKHSKLVEDICRALDIDPYEE